MYYYVHAEIAPRVHVAPREFTVPQPVTEPFEQSLSVTWLGDQKSNILRAEVNVPELTADVEEKGGRQSVVLRAPVGYELATNTFPKVIVHTDDKDLPSFPVSIRFSQPNRGRREITRPDPGQVIPLRVRPPRP